MTFHEDDNDDDAGMLSPEHESEMLASMREIAANARLQDTVTRLLKVVDDYHAGKVGYVTVPIGSTHAEALAILKGAHRR